MKLTIEQKTLADVVAFGAKELPRNTASPAMLGLKLTAVKKTGALTVTGWDYDIGTTATVGAEVHAGGKALVSGRLLADVTAKLPRGLDVHVTTDNTHMVLECGRARFTLPLMPVSEYPTLPTLPPSVGHVDAELFAEAVAQVVVCLAKEDTLPVLQSVQLEAFEDELLMTATDRYRLVFRRLPWSKSADADMPKVLIPGRTLADAAKALDGDGNVRLHLPGEDDGLVGWSGDDREISGRLTGGEHSDYSKIRPEKDDLTCTVRVEAATLAATVNRVALVAARNAPVYLQIDDGQITVTGGSSDDGLGLDIIDAQLVGEPLTVAFNPTYLAELVKLLADVAPEMELGFTDPVNPALLQPATGDDRDPDLQYVLMPIRGTTPAA